VKNAMKSRWPARLLLAAVAVLPMAGCERAMRDMYDQPKLMPGDRSALFPEGPASRPPPPGAVARAVGDAAAVSGAARGEAETTAAQAARAQAALPAVPGRDMLLRGQERYTVYCLPCHGAVGEGDGMVVRRGFPAPPSWHQDRLRQAPDRHFYNVITEGQGVMYPFADRVEPQDRWAIVAYVRALQTSQHVALAVLPEELRKRLAPALAAAVDGARTSSAPTGARP
jgi:mono/diheme cytochrome c family protein